MLSSSNNYWPEVEQNLRWEREKWGQLVKLLGIEGADSRTARIFYVEVVQELLLFGSKTKVMTPRMGKYLEGFHRREVQWMAGMVPRIHRGGTWVYPPIEVALETVGLDEIGGYISHHQNTFKKYNIHAHHTNYVN